MEKRGIIKKFLTVAAVSVLGAGLLAACGNKETEEQDEYVYSATYERIKNSGENTYTTCMDIDGDVICSVMCEYAQNEQKFFFKLYNIETKEEKTLDINDERIKTNGYIQYCHAFSDNTFGAILSVYDEKTMENEYYYTIYSNSGEVISDSKLSFAVSPNGYFYLGEVVFDEDKNIITQSDSNLYVFDKNGKVIKTLTTQNWINNLLVADDGRVYITTYLDEKGLSLCPVKADFSGLDERMDVVINNANIYPAENNKIFISGETTLKLYDPASNTTENVWDWLDIDVEGNDIKDITINSDGTYKLISQVWSEDFQGIEIATIEKKKSEGNAKKKLVYGCFNLDYFTKKAIIDFNKNNNEYRISVKNYSDENEDWNTISERLGADLTRGEIDIVDLSNGLNYRKLAASKALAPLDDYYKKDINNADYFANVFDAFRVNGKIYCVVPSVSINTLGISKDYSNGKGSITLDEFIELRKNNPDKEFMPYATKEQMLFMCLMYTINDYVDFDKGTCSFDTDNFKKVMEFANSFRSSEEFEYNEDYDDWSMLQNGDMIMEPLSVSDYQEIQVYSKLMKGGLDVTGYPVSSGSGHVLMAGTQLGIAEKSKVKDGAWEFVKSFLSENCQTGEMYYNGFPVLRSAFDDRMETAMKGNTYVDENGVEHEVSVGSWGNGHIEIEITKASQQEIDLIKKIYESADTSAEYDDKLFEIINEELGGYFAGQKSADEVASIIQSRVKLYLAESR